MTVADRPEAPAPSSEPADESRVTSHRRLRRRLPDVVLEAVLIFFAVVLALAAEEWRENRDRLELAERALHAVTEEIRSNIEELERNAPTNLERLESAREVLAELREGEQPVDADVGFEISLLSSAAWESARMSQAVQFMDLRVVRELSEVYEVQALYERMQLDIVDRIGEIARIARDDPRSAVEQGVSSLGMVVKMHEALLGIYRAGLEELEET